jgi:hypothetical protein
MPDPITHSAAAVGAVTAAIAFVFDVPSAVVFAAFSGACFGVAMSESLGLYKALAFILAGTAATGYTVPIVIHYVGDYPARGVAFILAFVLIRFRAEALDLVKRGIGKVFS